MLLTLLLLRSPAEADDDYDDDSFSRCRYNNNDWVNQAKQRTGLIVQQWPLVLVIIRFVHGLAVLRRRGHQEEKTGGDWRSWVVRRTVCRQSR
jgi:hypothetical protein